MKKKIIIYGSIITIVVIAALIPIPRTTSPEITVRCRIASVDADFTALEIAINEYVKKTKRLPKLGDDLIHDLYTQGIITREKNDPWGEKYTLVFSHDKSNLVIKSAGKDQVLGTSDDLEQRLKNNPNQGIDPTLTDAK